MRIVPTIRTLAAALATISLLSGCASGAGGGDATVVRVYTSVTQDTVDAVVAGFEAANPGVTAEVFRAPTGELAARIAAEQREGGGMADVLWLTDPLSIQQYARDGLLREWSPKNAEAVASQYKTKSFFGTRILNMVIVASEDADSPPADWPALADTENVVVPDPGFAGSAFAALGFFALDPAYGMEYYTRLAENGATQVRSPGDVVAGVAEGRHPAGITLDRTTRDAVDDGSPVVLVWPESGAIALYSPIAVLDATESDAAEAFVDYVLSVEAQEAIAATGWEPVRDDVEWPHGGPQQTLDWDRAFDRQDELLADYRAIFGGG